MLPITLPENDIEILMGKAQSKLEGYELTVDLENLQISDTEGYSFNFATDMFRRDCLMKGLDDINITLQNENKISIYEEANSMSFE